MIKMKQSHPEKTNRIHWEKTAYPNTCGDEAFMPVTFFDGKRSPTRLRFWRFPLLLISLAILLLASSCSPVQLSEEIHVTGGGFAFRQIPDYKILTTDSGAAMMAPWGETATGPAIDMSGHHAEEDIAIDEVTDALLDPNAAKTERSEIKINGNPGISMTFTYEGEHDAKIKGRIVVVKIEYPHTYYYFYMVGWTDANQWDDSFAKIYDAVLDSVTFLSLE